MAEIDAYTDADLKLGNKGVSGNSVPGNLWAISGTFEVGVADSILSKYRIAHLNADLIPFSLCIMGDDALDITYFDVGLYLPGAGGAAVDIDCFADNLAVNGDGIDSADLPNNALVSLPIDDIGKPLWEIAAVKLAGTYTKANHPGAFDLVVHAVAASTSAATVSFRGLFIQG